jgi:methionyl-tRNA formyltransferase
MVTPLRAVFFGTPKFAVPTLEALVASSHTVCGVITQPDRPRGRGRKIYPSPVKAAAEAHEIPVLQPVRLSESPIAEALRAWQIDVGVVAAYGKLIPEILLDLPRLGMINVHASLLPRHRGASPVHHAIIGGDAVTGVTIMRVARDLDAGATFARAEREIASDETTEEVERDLATLGARLLVDVLDSLASGTTIETPQDDRHATYAPRLTKADGVIDWTLPAQAIHNRVRGLHTWPHAYSAIEGRRVVLLRTRAMPGGGHELPGTVVEPSRASLTVATGHGGRLAIDIVQLDGRRPMTVRDFLAGHPIAPGARFANP